MKSTRRTPGPETAHAIGGLVRVGVVETVDLETGTAIVLFGDQKSPPLQWLGRASSLTMWCPPGEGEQVLVIAPENDIEQGVILGGLFSDTNPPVNNTLKLVVSYLEGAEASYDPETQEIRLMIPGKIVIEAEEGIEITAKVTITGDVSMTGDVAIEGPVAIEGDVDLTGGMKATKKVEAEDDVVGGGKSLKGHRHLGVQTGPGVSGAPQ